ncbi:MAG: hypothetical protein M3505_04045 [Verrucomicrobiota bacterium]|nr:hypothetical protein [Verrucomicrobiota bacterium]
MRFTAILAAAVAVFAWRNRRVHVDTVGVTSVPEGSLPGALGHFVAVLNTVNSESDAEYVSSLARLRSDKEQVLADASRLLWCSR